MEDPSVYVRSVAADAIGCLVRRSPGEDADLLEICVTSLLASLTREENRPGMDRVQNRSIKFVRPTDDCDVCEGIGIDHGFDRFEPVRSAVRENALWSLVTVCSQDPLLTLETTENLCEQLIRIIRSDENLFSVGFAMDALQRLDTLNAAELLEIFSSSPIRPEESLLRGVSND